MVIYWKRLGRMLFHSLKGNKKTKKDFYNAFNRVFANKKIRKWKFKFYFKAYFKAFFDILIKFKK
jgi:hypothetical protein